MPTTNGNDLAKIACHIIGNSQLSSESRIDTNADAHPHAFMQLVFGSSVVSLLSSSPLCIPFSFLRIYLFAKCSMALIDVPRRQQLKRQRQRHRLVRGVKLAGILGLRQVQINNDNRHQTADNSHQTTTTSRCCTLCKQRDPQTEDQTQTQSHHSQRRSRNTKLICQSVGKPQKLRTHFAGI